MNKYTACITAMLIMTMQAHAQEVNLPSAVSTNPASSDSIANMTPTPAPSPIPTPTTIAKVKEEAPKPVTGILQDGTRIEISDDGTVTLSNTDGSKSIAPDGVYTLRDETTFAVKDGKKTDQ